MRGYAIRRLALIIPTIILVSIIVFLSIRLIPGDIVDSIMADQSLMGNDSGSALKREVIEHRLGIDAPIPVQYVRWTGNIILHGSLGKSLRGEFTVNEKIAGRLPVTFELGIMAILIGLLIATPIGIYSAIRQDTVGDYVGRSLSILFISIPSFWLGAMIMIYPSIWWRWSPSMELIPFSKDPLGNLGMFIIPSFILGMAMSGTTMRMIRTMMLEVLRQDYIRTAWSKGLKERVVVVRHTIRNAFIPVATIIGYQIPMLVGGSVIIEQIFQLPGLGRLALDSLNGRDYTVVSGINLVVGTVVMLSNLVVDLTYVYLDPRVRYR
jgi:peptide/nickel transport system permease protein